MCFDFTGIVTIFLLKTTRFYDPNLFYGLNSVDTKYNIKPN